MHQLFYENIRSKKLIKDNDNILLALSGGPDSVFLFYNLIELKNIINFKLYVSHINHMYRGEFALNDESFVKSLCNEHGIVCFVKRKNVSEYSKEKKMTEEEAGRAIRYSFFEENLRNIGGGKVAVAHNFNDQAETVLQRIIRGSGVDGLSAMNFKSENIIRPILNIKKSEIEKYLKIKGYTYCTDQTNYQDIYGRNKIRLNLIPYIEKNFNQNIQEILFRMSEAMQGDKEIIKSYIKSIYDNVLISQNKEQIIIDICKLKTYEDYEIRRIIRYMINQLKGDTKNLQMKNVEYAINFIKNCRTGKQIDLTQMYCLEINYNEIILRKTVEIIEDFEYNIDIDKEITINNVKKIVNCKLINKQEFDEIHKLSNELMGCSSNLGSENFYENQNMYNLYFDYESIEGRLKIRNRRNGDVIKPIGMTGKKKIKDIFIDMKVPLNLRNKKLILADDVNILWVEGYRIHDDYKINSKTKKILNIKVAKIMEDYTNG